MDDSESLSHSKWECKYHVVFIPKCRRKTLYEQLRPHLGEVFRKLAKYKDTCNAASVTFIPVGVDTFGATGPYAASFLGKLFSRYAKRAGRAEERYRGQHASR